jgi:1-deoxy-D-xylulose-5-phosphate reductoisomerase
LATLRRDEIIVTTMSLAAPWAELSDGPLDFAHVESAMGHALSFSYGLALAHPERLPLDLPRLDLAAIGQLDFEVPDRKRFPCLDLAYAALAADEAAPAVLNAANEVAVAAFLAGRVSFPGIAAANAATLEAHVSRGGQARLSDLDDVERADRWARRFAAQWLAAAGGGQA